MSSANQKPANAWRWFDPRGRDSGSFAFILNRITAIGLTVYLYVHLGVLRKLAQGPGAYDSFIETAHSPLFVFLEFLVIVAGVYHGLNGLRIALTSFNIGVRQQKLLFYLIAAIAAISGIYFIVYTITG